MKKNLLMTLIIETVPLIVSGLVTRLGNQPINKEVMKWNTNNLPANWTTLREKWWAWHIVRTLTSFVALALLSGQT